MICKKCNTDNNDKFTYCYNCGASLDPNAQDDSFAPDIDEGFMAYDSDKVRQILDKKASSPAKSAQTDYNVLLEMTLASAKYASPIESFKNEEESVIDAAPISANEDKTTEEISEEKNMVPTDDEISSIFVSDDRLSAKRNTALNESDYIPADIRKKEPVSVSSESEVDKRLNKYIEMLSVSANDTEAKATHDNESDTDDFFSQAAIDSIENNIENNTTFKASAVESIAKSKNRNPNANKAQNDSDYNTFDDDLKTLSEGVNFRRTTSVPFSSHLKKKKRVANKKNKAVKEKDNKKNKVFLYRIIAILVIIAIIIGLIFTIKGIVNSISGPDPTPSATPDNTPGATGDISFTVTDGTENVDGFIKYSFHITTNADKVIVLGNEYVPNIDNIIDFTFDERDLYDAFYEDGAVYGDPIDISLEFKAIKDGFEDYVTTKNLTVNGKFVPVTNITPSVDSTFETSSSSVEISFTTVPGASVVIDSQDYSEFVDENGNFSATLPVPSETKLFFITVSAEKHRAESFEISVHRNMDRYFTCDNTILVKADKKEIVTLTGTVSPGSTITVSDYITVSSPAVITEAGTYSIKLLMPKFGYVAFEITATLNGESTSIEVIADNMQDWKYYSQSCWGFSAAEYDKAAASESYHRGQRYVFDATVKSIKKESDRYTVYATLNKDNSKTVCIYIMTTGELKFTTGDSIKVYGNRYGITDSYPAFYTNTQYMYKN